MKIVGIIPARYDSVRFPGKPLADVAGKPVIQRVYEQASQVALFSDVIVATDDARIEAAVRQFGGQARMTARTHQTGTDRLAEVARTLDADIVVNVQGDEPLIQPDMIEQAIRPLFEDSDVSIGTLKHKIMTPDELFNPNVVKVITTPQGRAIYFSRSPIPFIKGKEMRRDGFAGLVADGRGTVVTRPVVFSGSHFFVNADARFGKVTVEVEESESTLPSPPGGLLLMFQNT